MTLADERGASPLALVFPAVSLGAADQGIGAASRVYHRAGRKYLLGE